MKTNFHKSSLTMYIEHTELTFFYAAFHANGTCDINMTRMEEPRSLEPGVLYVPLYQKPKLLNCLLRMYTKPLLMSISHEHIGLIQKITSNIF